MANPSTPNAPGSMDPRANDKSLDTQTLKTDASKVIDEAQDLAGKVKAEATEQVSQLADQAQAKVSEATDKVKGMAAEQKDLLADQIGGVASAMDRVADDLESSNGSSAHYARIIADNAGKLSDTIRSNDVDQILNMAQDLGRKQPVAFLATAALLGFAASRFLTASAKRPAETSETETGQSSYSTPSQFGEQTSPPPAYDSGRP